MKTTFLIVTLLLLPMARAEEIKCPDSYPANEVALPEIPAGHKGSGLIRGAHLSSAYIYVGKLHSDPNGFDAMQLVPKRVAKGWDSEDYFTPQETKWLVCVYGGDGRTSVDNPRTTGSIEWWEKIKPAITHCSLHFREVKLPHQTPSDWTAVAACE